MTVFDEIERYEPFNDEEKADKAAILAWRDTPDIFLRSNAAAHMTASAWIVDPSGTEALMIRHKIYRSLTWPGGHADGDGDLFRVACREAREETGLDRFASDGKIFSLEVLAVAGHTKKGVYVPSHLHLNVTYRLTADRNAPLTVNGDETDGVLWVPLTAVADLDDEPWMTAHVYRKLIAKT